MRRRRSSSERGAASAIFEGAAEIQANVIARRLLERGVIGRHESVVLFNTGGALKYLDVLPRG